MTPSRKAIFLDRDGVINSNRDQYYTWKNEHLVINPGVPDTLKALKQKGYLLIVVSNQGGVSKGEYTREDVEALHRHLNELLDASGAKVDDFYYCPHHQNLEACLCRKPLPLMLEKAMARYGIDPSLSWMIGDSDRDVEAGEAVGLNTYLHPSNHDLRKVMDKIF